MTLPCMGDLSVWDTCLVANKIFYFGAEAEKALGMYEHRQEYNIKIYSIEMGCPDVTVDWIKLAQDRDQWQAVANRVLKLCVSQKTG